MTIEELIGDANRRRFASMPEADALTEEDALLEADLRDVRYDPDVGDAALLFDLRNALNFEASNTALVVLRGAIEVEQQDLDPSPYRWHTRYVMGSIPSVDQGIFSLKIICLRGFRFNAQARAAEFYVGAIPGLPEAPPNFDDDDDEAIFAGMPDWASLFLPEWATFIESGRPNGGESG